MTKLLHMTSLQCMLSPRDLRCFDRNIHFVAFYALLCGAKINPKILSVEKNDNYHVWMWGNGDTGKLKPMTMLALLVKPQFAKSLCLFRLFPLTGYIGWVGWLHHQ